MVCLIFFLWHYQYKFKKKITNSQHVSNQIELAYVVGALDHLIGNLHAIFVRSAKMGSKQTK